MPKALEPDWEVACRLALHNLAKTITEGEDAATTCAAEEDPDALPAADLFRRKRGRSFAASTK
ncbi:MAG: hypothetical protein FD153_561, partial [Rhodospirillaceae bacterium]